MPKELKNLKKYILKHYGKRCKEYAPLCAVCEVWRAYDLFVWIYIPNKITKHEK